MVLRSVLGGKVRRFLGKAGLASLVFGSGFVLLGGTKALMELGLSRSEAGTITAVFVVLVALVGLGAFAKYAIDW